MKSYLDVRRLPQRVLFPLLALLLFLLAGMAPVAAAATAKKDLAAALKFSAVPQTSFSQLAPQTNSHPNDERALQIENRLREIVSQMRASRQSANAVQPPTAEKSRQTRTRKSRAEIIEGLEVPLRQRVGTPLQIRVKKEAREKGAVLERAAGTGSESPENDKQTARNFLRAKRNLLRIADPDEEFAFKQYRRDDLNRRHLRYQQTYKNIPIWAAEVNIHLDADGDVELLDGAFVPTPRRLVTKPVWSAEEAVAAAKKAVAGSQDAEAGKPLLVIYSQNNRVCRLAWKVELPVSAAAHWLVMVDAMNGKILTSYNKVATSNTGGSGVDLFGQTQALDVWLENNTYYLSDSSKAMFNAGSGQGTIDIYDAANAEEAGNAYLFSSRSATSGWLADGVSLAFNLSETYDYFLEKHNLSSFDGNGTTIKGIARLGQNYDNAYWNPEAKAFFFGDGGPYAGALDVVAHEFTHAVTSSSCDLIYQDQPGALNESFSDIFGEMVEARSFGDCDWINGAALGGTNRNLNNPSAVEIFDGYYYPAKMSQFYQNNHPVLQQLQNQDFGGVHINMTIMTHCFYLLAEGLNNAIGIENAAKIFHRAQTVHLVRSSQFIDARLACITSAEELFGAGSTQVNKVKEAFDAVEIYENSPTPDPLPTAPVSGSDAEIFIYSDYYYDNYDNYYEGYFLGRQEDALSDPAQGSMLSCYDVTQAAPSITGDGSWCFFVDSIQDACFIPTDGSECEDCLGIPGSIHSVAMSPDGNVYGFVLLDAYGDPINQILVYDYRKPAGQESTVYTLTAPATEGASLSTISYADSMDFTSDNRYLVYDALNVFQLGGGYSYGVWSIYVLDLASGWSYPIIQPYPNDFYDVGYPSLSQTSNHVIVFDLLDYSSGTTSVITYDFFNAVFDIVGEVDGSWTCPGFNGDDSAVIYSMTDYSATTGYSLVRQPLAANGLSPAGEASWEVRDADFGVVYRRGAYTPPGPEDIDNDGDGYSEAAGDCNDNDSRIYPGAPEICGDGIDQDCDGRDLVCPADPNYTTGPYNYYAPYLSTTNGDWTGLALANASTSNSSPFKIEVFGSSGETLLEATETLPVDGQESFNLAPASAQGWIRVNSHQPLNGLVFLGAGSSALMADIPFVADLAAELVVPHIAADSTWETTIYICNPQNSALSVNLKYINQAGAQVAQKPVTLAAHGRTAVELSQAFAAQFPLAGKIIISASAPCTAFALYQDGKSGGTYYAGINSVPMPAGGGTLSYYVPYFDSANNNWSGLGLSNCGAAATTAQVSIFSQGGPLLGPENINLAANGQDNRAIAQNFATRGWLKVTSTTPLAGLCFIGTSNHPQLMADVPFTAELSTHLVVPHIAQDNYWTTDVLVCNPSSRPAQVIFRNVAKSGSEVARRTEYLPGPGSTRINLGQLFGGNQGSGKLYIDSSEALAAFALYSNTGAGGTYYAGINAEAIAEQ